MSKQVNFYRSFKNLRGSLLIFPLNEKQASA